MTAKTKKEREMSDYIRVTEVLDPFFDKSKIDPEVLKNAQERGTAVHDAIEMMLKGLGEWITPRFEPYVESFKLWMQAVDFNVENIVKLEHRMFNDDLMLTGQCDLIYRMNGGYALIDFKTSHSPSKSWPLQLSAYAHLSDEVINQRIVLHLQKDGSPARTHEYDDCWELYKKAYDIFVHFNPGKLKKKGGRNATKKSNAKTRRTA